MAKVTAKKRTARRKPDALAVAAALERAKLKRLVQAKRDVARLVNELARATKKADARVLQFALDVIAETEPETLDADSRAAVAQAAAAGR